MRQKFRPNQKLLRLSRAGDFFTCSNACENVAVPGSIGSAKTSTTLTMWAQAYFEAGFGGLCMGPKAGSRGANRRFRRR